MLPNFDETYQFDHDASFVGIGKVLSQDDRSFVFYAGKLNCPKLYYSNYNEKIYAVQKPQGIGLIIWRSDSLLFIGTKRL